MALPSEAVARYLQILESDTYRDLTWADDLQERMRRQGLMEAGRLAAPILRPHFLPKSQFATLARTTERLAAIAEQIYSLAVQSGPLLSRLRLLPAERKLAELPPSCSRLSVSAYAEAHFHQGRLQLSGLRAACPPRLAYMDLLTENFASLAIIRDLQLSGFPLTAACSGGRFYQAILKTWKEFGGKTVPRIAVLHGGGAAGNEGQFLADLLSRGGADARLICPESLEYADGRLKSRDFIVDVVFRDISTRQLLLQINLSSPLFRACQDNAVCVVNSFRSDIANRPSFFSLLTDGELMRHLAAADRKLIHETVLWTRVVAPGSAEFRGKTVDLLEFIRKNRQHLALLPNDEAAALPSFDGGEMTASGWDRAITCALSSVYVAQAKPVSDRESFPVYQYGNLEMQCADATVRPHIFNGKVHGTSAVLARHRRGSSTALAIAPVLILDTF